MNRLETPLVVDATREDPLYIIRPRPDVSRKHTPPLLLGPKLATAMIAAEPPNNGKYIDRKVWFKTDHADGVSINGEKPADPCDGFSRIRKGQSPLRIGFFNDTIVVGVQIEVRRGVMGQNIVVTEITNEQPPLIVISRGQLSSSYPALQYALADPYLARRARRPMVMLDDDFDTVRRLTRGHALAQID